ncbi:MAG: acetylglutamate kinase [Bryobacteraceae bacterium]
MRLLVKLGGTLLDTAESRQRLAGEIAALAASHQVVVVHGGGKQMTRFLTEHGVESRFVNGLRVSTPEVIDAVLKVLAGTVNHELVAALYAAGAASVGLSGVDAGLAEAEPISEELGAVGRVTSTNAKLLDLLVLNGYVPVVACVAGDRSGRIYNVNADQMAVACAAGFRVDRLIFLTDVDGVRGAEGTTLSRLTIAECGQLVTSGVATGGMQAKLEAACLAVERGTGAVVIAPGSAANACARIVAGEPMGTAITAE